VPFIAHPDVPPVEGEAIIWRYMNFVKFISILETGSLFFARADKLGDPFEGSLFKNSFVRVHSVDQNDFVTDQVSTLAALDANQRAAIVWARRKWVTSTFVNCWYARDDDSDAMWRIYASINSVGIAVRTTVGDLKRSLQPDRQVFIGRVRYTDYEGELGDAMQNALLNVIVKRRCFEHESEVRAMTFSVQDPPEHGIQVPVDLRGLIREVVIAPQSQSWFAELVDALVRRYGLALQVRYSPIGNIPYWGD
jgi:hypothetical protein